jgi:hypothetical protein
MGVKEADDYTIILFQEENKVGYYMVNKARYNKITTCKHRAIDIWRDKVFDMLLDEKKIDPDTVSGMKEWKNSGFSVDNSVIIEAEDKEGMQRLVEYISRCPFSLTRMISTTKEGDILYRASNPQCIAFPIAGDQELTAGNSRNFEVFKSLDFLANVTQHITDKGEHLPSP